MTATSPHIRLLAGNAIVSEIPILPYTKSKIGRGTGARQALGTRGFGRWFMKQGVSSPMRSPLCRLLTITPNLTSRYRSSVVTRSKESKRVLRARLAGRMGSNLQPVI